MPSGRTGKRRACAFLFIHPASPHGSEVSPAARNTLDSARIPRASKLLICGLFQKGRVLAQDGEAEHAASTSDRLMVRPDEFQEMPRAMSAHQTWVDWHQDNLSGHDGLIRADHPLLLRALDRLQSASSLVKLLRDPLGYLWTYGFGWREPKGVG